MNDDNGSPNAAGGVESQKPVFLKFAPFWKRLLAFVVDMLLLNLIMTAMVLLVYRQDMQLIAQGDTVDAQLKLLMTFWQTRSLPVNVAGFVIQSAYFTLSWMARGQTLGAMIFRIAVITVDMKKMRILPALVRSTLLWFSSLAFYVPLIFVVNSVYHQRIHDALSVSVVIELPEVELKDKDGKKAGSESDLPADTKDSGSGA